MDLARMAWRNLWRNGRRTVVTVGAMTFGLWVMILYAGLVTGMIEGMEADILDFEIGDGQIHAAGWFDDPSLYSSISDVDAVVARLEAEGWRASPRLLAGGLGASGDASAGVQLRGLDVARDGTALRLADRVVDGAWLDAAAPGEVVIGRRLARTLDAKPGSELVILSQGADGSMANALYKVRGVLGPVADGTDRAAVLMTEAAFRELMAFPEGAHEIVVRRPAELPMAEFGPRLEELAAPHEARTWRRLMPTVAQMVDSAKSVVYLVFGIVYLAIGILVLNAMLMAVFERIREFGVLKAIGVSPGAVFTMILLESLFQLGLSIVLGVVASLPFAAWLSTSGLNVASLSGTSMMGLVMQPVWLGRYGVDTYAGPIVVLSVIVALAIAYPAVKAARIEPLDAMRYR